MSLVDLAPVRRAPTTGEMADGGKEAGGFSRGELPIVIGLTLASMLACLIDLGSRSLWNDELHSALVAVHHGTSLWSAVTADGGNMALYYLLLHLFVSFFGDGQLALRVPSALAGAALTPVVYLLGRRMFGMRTAVFATAIVAVSPALVVWNQQARGYSLGTLLTACSLLALLRALECPTRLRWCVYGLLAVLSIYTIVYAAMFLIAQWIPLIFWRQACRQVRPLLTVVGVVMVAYVPVLVLMLRSGTSSLLTDNPLPSTRGGARLLEELHRGSGPWTFLPQHLLPASSQSLGCCAGLPPAPSSISCPAGAG